MKLSYKAGKVREIIIMLFIIIVVIICLVFIPKGTVEAPKTDTFVKNQPTRVSVATSTQTYEQPSFSTKVEVPVVSGLNNLNIQKKINNKIAEKIHATLTDFENQAINTKVVAGPDTKSILEIKLHSFSVVKDALLSIRLVVLTYFSGSAHPITVSETSNFDLKTGADLGLIDIFDTSTINYLNAISISSIKLLKAQLATLQNISPSSPDFQFFEEGASSNPENFSTFLVEDKGIRFIFGQYQVAPFVYGEQEALVPYSELKLYMKKNSLSEALLK